MGNKMERRNWFTARQSKLFRLVGKNKDLTSAFYLTGGTALSAVYYNYRISNDLDFFTNKEISPIKILNFIYSTKQVLHWKKVTRIATNINGFKLSWDKGEDLVIDFIYYSF